MPWWRSAPRIAIIAGILVAGVALVLVLTRPDGESKPGEVFLQAASAKGPDPFTDSTARKSSATASPTATPSASAGATAGTRTIDGSAPGLYGGTRNASSCDVGRQIDFLARDQTKSRAFADVLGIDQGRVPSYLRSLTPVQLRADTRVTNHGFKNGKATGYQAVLQAGTAVLVDSRGVPRVRCACGNPLTPPVALTAAPKQKGSAWPSYSKSDVVAVTPARQVVNVFVVLDVNTGTWFERPRGDTGSTDTPTTPPTGLSTRSPSPSGSTTAPTAPTSPTSPASPTAPTSPTGPATTTPPGSPTAPQSPTSPQSLGSPLPGTPGSPTAGTPQSPTGGSPQVTGGSASSA